MLRQRSRNRKAKSRTVPKIIQFNWRRHWSKKVAPYLNEELVQFSLDAGMMTYDPDWKRGDAPYVVGAIGFNRIVKGKLSWYQPLNRCHHIAFFSMAIGVLNYPELDWRFVTGERHTVPVGYDAENNPRVVMDTLVFELHDAEKSIALAQEDFPKLKPSAEAKYQWDKVIDFFLTRGVPPLKKRAKELRASEASIVASVDDGDAVGAILTAGGDADLAVGGAHRRRGPVAG
jgi:hypothetical protein